MSRQITQEEWIKESKKHGCTLPNGCNSGYLFACRHCYCPAHKKNVKDDFSSRKKTNETFNDRTNAV